MKKFLTNPKHQVVLRKKLRSNSTSAEIVLWCAIKNKQLEGRKFRRQFGIGKYIVDFYCASENLAIELDGYDHFTEEGIKKDQIRDKFLEEKGVRVIHIENDHVFKNMDYVIGIIKENFLTNN